MFNFSKKSIALLEECARMAAEVSEDFSEARGSKYFLETETRGPDEALADLSKFLNTPGVRSQGLFTLAIVAI